MEPGMTDRWSLEASTGSTGSLEASTGSIGSLGLVHHGMPGTASLGAPPPCRTAAHRRPSTDIEHMTQLTVLTVSRCARGSLDGLGGLSLGESGQPGLVN